MPLKVATPSATLPRTAPDRVLTTASTACVAESPLPPFPRLARNGATPAMAHLAYAAAAGAGARSRSTCAALCGGRESCPPLATAIAPTTAHTAAAQTGRTSGGAPPRSRRTRGTEEPRAGRQTRVHDHRHGQALGAVVDPHHEHPVAHHEEERIEQEEPTENAPEEAPGAQSCPSQCHAAHRAPTRSPSRARRGAAAAPARRTPSSPSSSKRPAPSAIAKPTTSMGALASEARMPGTNAREKRKR